MNHEELQNSNGKSIDAHLTKWREFVSSGSISTSSILVKSHSESKSKRRKTEMIQVHGGRSIRSSGRKDKHSKVCTMRGPKDRRLRLSPKTAIEFYDVQDRLGYDRASKAIDWLMKAAKSAIDALDEPPPMHCVTENHSPPIFKTQEIHQGPDISIPGFSIFTDYTATSSSTEFRPNPDNDLSYQEGFLSALANTPQQIFDTNLEIARMQRSFAFANSNLGNSRGGITGDYDSFMNSVPPDFPGPSPGLGYSPMFTQREPLQSSINHFSPIGNQFPGIHFSREDFSSSNGAATLKEEENDNIHPFSTASFLHFQD